jgi:roadblock/LC7 domain-containing protein
MPVNGKDYLFIMTKFLRGVQMVSLEELFEMEGVTAIAQLDDMGRIVDWRAKGVVGPELKEAANKFVTSVTALLDEQARVAPRNWHPRRSWMYSGGDMTMIISGNQAIIIETAKADVDIISRAFGMACYPKK